MNKIIRIVTIILLSIPLFGIGQTSNGIFRDTTIITDTIIVECPRNGSQALIVSEYTFQIEVQLIDFKNELKSKIEKHKIEDDIALLNNLEKYDLAERIEFNVLGDIEQSRGKYILAVLLKKGLCCIRNTENDNQINKIQKVHYLENNHTGRRFYTVTNELIFETYMMDHINEYTAHNKSYKT